MIVKQYVRPALWAVGALVVPISAAAQTQTPTSPAAQSATVVVTGSRINRTDSETPSPLQVITAEEIQESGYTSIQDVLHQLTANGQGTLSQGFAGAFATGASGIALRGLTVGATLVLIDGHRMAPYPIGDDGERSFVDIANLPFDAIERVEVLKDGASAVYGSDAIAGVVNIILKKTFQGAKLNVDGGTSAHADGNTYHMSGIWGMGDLVNDGHNFYLSAEYKQQNRIRFEDRGGLLSQTDFTSSGGYNVTLGVPNDLNGGLARSGTGYITDPKGNIVGFMPGCNATTYAAGQCTYKDTWSQIQPPTKNYNVVGRFTQILASDWEVSVEGSYLESKDRLEGGPVRAFTGGYQGVTSGPGVIPTLLDPISATTIPSTNPSFPAGTGLNVGNLRYTLLNLGPTIDATDSKSYRAIADLSGKVGTWDAEFSAGFTEVKLYIDALNYAEPATLQAALDSTTAPFLVGQQNTTAVNNFVAPPLHTGDSSKLSFAHIGTNGDVYELPGGPLAVAVGADYLQRNQDAVAPWQVANGLLNSFSNNFTVGTQQVASAYAESDAFIVKQFEVDAAVRYDHYNLSGGKASPKIGFKFTPIPEFALRGTASKGFRAPGPAENGQAGQTYFAGTSADPILCKNPGVITAPGNFALQCNVAVPTLQGTNPNLKPETSKSFTLGVIVEPFKDFSATLDLYSIEIDNQIVSGGPTTVVRGSNLTPLPEYQPDGTTMLVTPPVAPILYQTISYINANTTKTDGADVGFELRHRWNDVGEFQSQATWSFTRRYDLTIDGVTYSLAGTHGPSITSGDTGNPKSRVQWSNTFARGPWQVTGTLNYISSFSVTDPSAIAFGQSPMTTCLESLTNQGGAAGTNYAGVLANGIIPAAVGCTVKHFTTFDLYGRFDVTKKVSLHGSVTNLFNTKAPADWVTYGGGVYPFNPSLHTEGAIGAFFSLGATYTLF